MLCRECPDERNCPSCERCKNSGKTICKECLKGDCKYEPKVEVKDNASKEENV